MFFISHIAVGDTWFTMKGPAKVGFQSFLLSLLLSTNKRGKKKKNSVIKGRGVLGGNDSTKEEKKRGWMANKGLSCEVTHPGLMWLSPSKHAKMLLGISVHDLSIQGHT